MKKIEAIKKFFQQNGAVNFRITKIAGSSPAEVFFCNREVYKVASLNEAEKELGIYRKFQRHMGMRSYNIVFPETTMLLPRQKNAIWKIEFIGEKNMEDLFFDFKKNEGKKNVRRLINLNRDVLKKIGLILKTTKQGQKTSKKAASLFFDEILYALKINLQMAGLNDGLSLDITDRIRKCKSRLLLNFVSSDIHKDLTVGNIILDEETGGVKFIDPREFLAYSKKTGDSGNMAVDLVGYYVSVLRKEMEINVGYKKISLRPIKLEIEKEIEKYEKAKIFGDGMKDLCFLFWYSVYCACRCDYCLSKKRRWLYQKMKEKLFDYFLKMDKACSK